MTPFEEKLEQIIGLLTEIRDALNETVEELDYDGMDCRCLRATGEPISNCPICSGTGRTS